MGPREVIGIALFAVALAITISLTFNEDAMGSDRTLPTISTGQLAPTLTPTPTATPTPVPILALGDPLDAWFVSYFRHDADGQRQLETRDVADAIDLAYDNAPFPDMQDDNWSVELSAPFEQPAGRYHFWLETSGNADVTINGTIVSSTGDLEATKTVEALFDHLGGRMDIVVEADDRGGAFRLRLILN